MKKYLKQTFALIMINAIYILADAYVNLSFNPIIERLFISEDQIEFRSFYLIINLLLIFSISGYFSVNYKEKSEE